MTKYRDNISLIIAVYNQSRNLELVLDSVRQQTNQNIEIVIADDGSTDGTEKVIEQFRVDCPHIPIIFVTQEDEGFRKTMILNKAIKRSRGDYLIFLDGDMLLEKRFIDLHLQYRESSQVLCGYRGVKLTEAYTEKVVNGEKLFSTHPINLLVQRIKGNVENPMRGLILHNRFIRKFAVPARDSLSGCNFSLYRKALEAVNGFNEDILEHGFDDYELGHRLKIEGYKFFNISKMCNTYHLYHPTRKTRRKEVAEKIARVDASTNSWCENGLSKKGSSYAS